MVVASDGDDNYVSSDITKSGTVLCVDGRCVIGL